MLIISAHASSDRRSVQTNQDFSIRICKDYLLFFFFDDFFAMLIEYTHHLNNFTDSFFEVSK